MHIELNRLARPTLLATLIAASFGATTAQAAVRENLENIKTPLVANLAGGNVAVHNHIGVAATELQAERSHKFENGRVVTRHVQLHQGVPVWDEAVVEHRDTAKTTPSVSGFLLRNLQNDLPSVKPKPWPASMKPKMKKSNCTSSKKPTAWHTWCMWSLSPVPIPPNQPARCICWTLTPVL
jgi:pseudolysin/vibriolysin